MVILHLNRISMIIKRERFLILAVFMALVPIIAFGAGKKRKKTKQKAEVAIVDVAKTPRLFLYCNDKKAGMRVAVEDAEGQWNTLGSLFQSDYSTWGSEKNMYSPYIAKIGNAYVCVFEVNQSAPCFAVAYSEDMVTWRPQDYPRMT